MNAKSIPWFVIVGLAIALFLSIRSCRGRMSQEQVQTAIQLAGDSVRKVDSPAIAWLQESRIRLTKDSTTAHIKIDSLEDALVITRISLKQDKNKVMNAVAELRAALKASVDSATYRRLESNYNDLQSGIDDGIADVQNYQSQSQAKDSVQSKYIMYLEDLNNQRNNRIDTLVTSNQTLLNLLGQSTAAGKPRTVVSGGFNVLTSPGLTGAGGTLQLTAKNGSSYQVSADYTTEKKGLYQFTWLQTISFKRKQ